MFPWPPPPASDELAVPDKLLPPRAGGPRLSDVAAQLEQALDGAQYPRHRFLGVPAGEGEPAGFVLVAHMEQIGSDGIPSAERWSSDLPSVRHLSLLDFIKALAGAPKGHYRVIVFLVTGRGWDGTGQEPTGADAQGWLERGRTELPNEIGDLPYDGSCKTTALVYEFVKRSDGEDAEQVFDGRVTARRHLEASGILSQLAGFQ